MYTEQMIWFCIKFDVHRTDDLVLYKVCPSFGMQVTKNVRNIFLV